MPIVIENMRHFLAGRPGEMQNVVTRPPARPGLDDKGSSIAT
jgi:hypothetical protein